MKKMTLIIMLSFAVAVSASAQPGGGFQRQTPEERAAAIHAKLDSAFKLEPSKLITLDTALTILYKKQDERMQEIFSSGERPDRETMMAERKKYSDARDEMIKAMLTEEQFTIWKDKIEPSMRPQRPPGGGGMPGGGNN
jgi:periplasmic protein CpxP/Spy